MKNKLTICNLDGTISEYRDVEHFQTLENGVIIFEFGPSTVHLDGITPNNIKSSPPAGTKVTFNGGFSYEDYSGTATGEKTEKCGYVIIW